MTEQESGAGASMQITLLGGFAVRAGTRTIAPEAWRLSKARSLIKLLALAPAQRLPRDQVLDALWPDFAPEAAQNNLHTTLAAVRRALAPEGSLHLREGLLTLATTLPLRIDVAEFEAAALRAQRSGDPAQYQAALAHYGGELLPEDRYEDWLTARREALRATYQGLLFALAELQQQAGAETDATGTLRRLLADDPLHEAAHMALMRLYAGQGQQALAIRQYQTLRAALEAQLDTEPSAAVRRLYAAIVTDRVTPRRAAPERDAGEQPPRPKHNLPAALSSFVGRQREIGEIGDLLAGGGHEAAPPRLITLIGIGGMGKTRLSLAVAGAAAARYADGAWFVDLAPLRDPALVVGTVASVLGVRERSGQPPLATLCEALAAKHLLMVLDNCEHLLPAVREVAEGLLRGCPRVQILATSRERLLGAGEVAWAVPPLALPSLATDDVETLAGATAARLFIDRVRERLPQFALTAENAPAVAEICRRLDGLPLALELAAARTTVLTMQQLADRLDNALGLLTTRERTLPARQQTLRATLDWSYTLLPPDEQRLLARLSVFAGGCTLAAIEAVADAEPLALLDGLHTLGDQSLLQRQETPEGEARFRTLELVREYAQERLAASGEVAATRARHADYFLQLVETRLDQIVWQRQVLAEEDNLRAALRWATTRQDVALGLRLVNALVPFWANRGAYREGHDWIGRLLALAEQAAPDPPLAPLLLAHTFYGATILTWQSGDFANARRYIEEALARYRALDERPAIARSLRLLANVTLITGQHEAAGRLLDEAESLLRASGASNDLAMVLNSRGELLRSVYGDYAGAEAHYREALALLRADGLAHWVATLLSNLAATVLRRGGTTEALRLLRESLELRLALRNQRGIALCLEGCGSIAVALGRFTQAARCFGAADQLRLTIDSPRTSDPADEAEYRHYVALAQTQTDPATWEAALVAGRGLTLDEAITEALAMSGEPAHEA